MKKETNGRGGKITGVSFYIQRNLEYYQKGKSKKEKTKVELTKDELYEFVDEMRDVISFRLKTKEYITIAQAAEYDLDRIKYINEVAQEAKGEIENVVGFFIAA